MSYASNAAIYCGKPWNKPMLPVGTRVTIDSGEHSERHGSIAYRALRDDGALTYIVLLDEGFYAEDRGTYVSMLVVHPDNLTAS